MTTPLVALSFLQLFRQKLLGIFTRRADALFELIDALLLTIDPRSPVELSLSPAFRRRYSMVYDALQEGQVALGPLPIRAIRSRRGCRPERVRRLPCRH